MLVSRECTIQSRVLVIGVKLRFWDWWMDWFEVGDGWSSELFYKFSLDWQVREVDWFWFLKDILPDIPQTIPNILKRSLILIIFFGFLNFRRRSIQTNRSSPSSQLPHPPQHYGSNSSQPISQLHPQPVQALIDKINQSQSSYTSHQFLNHFNPPPALPFASSRSHIPPSTLPLVSAILIVNRDRDWREKGTVPFELVIRLLIRYPFIRELLIWNDGQATHLTHQVSQPRSSITQSLSLSSLTQIGWNFIKDFEIALGSSKSSPHLRIFNSPGSVGASISQHLACSLATHPTCYFNVRLTSFSILCSAHQIVDMWLSPWIAFQQDEDLLNMNLDTLYTKVSHFPPPTDHKGWLP